MGATLKILTTCGFFIQLRDQRCNGKIDLFVYYIQFKKYRFDSIPLN